jgi:hypothetical protein
MPDRNRDFDDLAGPNIKLTQFKAASKDFLKKFGPLIFIAVKAGVEHHWRHRDDAQDSETQSRDQDKSEDSDDGDAVQALRDEVKHLKKSLKEKEKRGMRRLKNGEREVEERLGLRSESMEPMYEQRPPHRDEFASRQPYREPYREEQRNFDDRGFGPQDDFLPGGRPSFGEDINGPYRPYWEDRNPFEERRPEPQPPQRYPQFIVPLAAPNPPQLNEPHNPTGSRDIVEDTRTIGKRHHRRDSSVPYRRFHDRDIPHDTIRAGKVALAAGAIEAIHVGKFDGELLGPRTVRVGTAMAASFGSNYWKSKGVEKLRTRDVVADVGTGLLVSRLVHGSAKKMEEREEREERQERGDREEREQREERERRWSY